MDHSDQPRGPTPTVWTRSVDETVERLVRCPPVGLPPKHERCLFPTGSPSGAGWHVLTQRVRASAARAWRTSMHSRARRRVSPSAASAMPSATAAILSVASAMPSLAVPSSPVPSAASAMPSDGSRARRARDALSGLRSRTLLFRYLPQPARGPGSAGRLRFVLSACLS